MLLISGPTLAQIPVSENISLYGDVRSGYFGQEREERDGSTISRHEIRTRARIGFQFRLSENAQLHVRYATRLSSMGKGFDPYWSTSAKRNNGLRLQEAAFDEAYLRLDVSPGLYFKAGRFQTGYTIPGAIRNAIQRNDSPNNDVQWTDGLLVSRRHGSGWQTDVIAQVHYGNWPTNTMRRPLDFSESDAFLTTFISHSKSDRQGLVRFRGVDLTFSPNALIVRPGDRSHYLAVSAKGALGWQTSSLGDIVWAAEGAWSIIQPDKAYMGFSGVKGEKTGGFGAQMSLSFMDYLDGHSTGFIIAAIEPALLTSEDYWNNSVLWEVRHIIQINRRLSSELRIRYRADLYQYAGVERKRAEYVPYARLTWRMR